MYSESKVPFSELKYREREKEEKKNERDICLLNRR